MNKKQSELSVITKAKELCSYVMIITQKSPKHFRYTFVSRMQNLALDVVENLIRANDIFLKKDDMNARLKRESYQRDAMTNLKVLGYISMLAMEQQCILLKQYEQISMLSAECLKMINAWLKSDKRRFVS